jgi:hypothetical protein
MPFGKGFIIFTPEASDGVRLPPGPSPPGDSGSSWPPSATDPTSGPYVIDNSGSGGTLFLLPLRWGDRLYLIRSGEVEAFCQSISAGREPRKVANGDQFLRRGDHAKRADGRPHECEAFQ